MTTHLQVPRTKEVELRAVSRDFTSLYRKKRTRVAVNLYTSFILAPKLVSKRGKMSATLERGVYWGGRTNGTLVNFTLTVCFMQAIKSSETSVKIITKYV